MNAVRWGLSVIHAAGNEGPWNWEYACHSCIILLTDGRIECDKAKSCACIENGWEMSTVVELLDGHIINGLQSNSIISIRFLQDIAAGFDSRFTASTCAASELQHHRYTSAGTIHYIWMNHTRKSGSFSSFLSHGAQNVYSTSIDWTIYRPNRWALHIIYSSFCWRLFIKCQKQFPRKYACECPKMVRALRWDYCWNGLHNDAILICTYQHKRNPIHTDTLW